MFDMDSVNRRPLEPGFGGRDHRAVSESATAVYGADGDGAEGWRLLCVSLFGGAPWGFTLRGGLEHGEALVITKVEDGSKAAGVRLQVGDELVNINDFPLSGYRQEAICLVKGSHKTLTLVVKRKNEPMIRPHSWHATKFTENQADAGKTQSAPSPVWQTRYDASTFNSDLTPGWDQTNLRRVSDQFSSLGSMDSLEHGNHPYPGGRLSPNKSNGNSVEHLAGGKRDSAYSSFSTSSGTPDYTLSKSNAASTENMLYKVNQWESGNRPSNGRHGHSLSEGVRQDDRVAYMQLSAGAGGRDSPRGGAEEQPGYRHSASGRSGIGPVWHIPDMRKNTDPSPPPPAPPLRSDSFAATKIHEKGLTPSYVGGHVLSKPQAKGLEMAPEISEGTHRGYRSAEPGPEPPQNYITSPKYDPLHPPPSDAHHPNRTDVVGPPPHPRPAYHKRQYSDESTFYPSSRSVANKPPNANCYSSMQELPTNNQNQVRKTAAPQNSTAAEQNPENYRPYSAKPRQHSQSHAPPPSQTPTARLEERNANLGLEMIQSGGDRTSVSSQGSSKERYNAPQNHNKDSNGLYSQHQVYSAGRRVEPGAREVREVQKLNTVMNPSFGNFPHPEISQPRSRDPPPDHFPSRNEAVWPQNIPVMHSHDNTRTLDAQGDPIGGNGDAEYFDPQKGRQVRRNDRFATTLRNEIQMRRAHLQKSLSAAGLSEEAEPEEVASAWKPSESASSSTDGSFTVTYKDHLKEAQARVLKATSFRRRDLEPVLLEHPGAEATPTGLRKEAPFLASVSEVPSSRGAPGGNHVPRIGGRKRFPVEKKTRSYSEPDKINSVGVQEPFAQDNAESVASRRKVFEVTAKPAYCKPVPKQSPPVSEDPRPAMPDERTLYGPGDSSHRLGTFAEYEATWNTQRSAAAPRTSGRYHSADNILDSGADERHKPSYFHERSRSSPSEDFYGPNVAVQGRKSAEYPAPVRTHGNHEESRSRLSDGGPRNLGPTQNQELPLPGGDAEENRMRDAVTRSPPNPAGPPLPFPDCAGVLAESSSYARSKISASPRPPPPPKRPEVTAPPAAASVSPSKDSTSSSSPIKRITPEPGVGPRNEAAPQAETPPAPPSRLTPPGMDIQRSPSPHFAPQRLTDKPPASVSRQDEAAGRMDQVTDENSAVRKVPIKIVHSESSTEKENRLYLYPSAKNPTDTQEPPVLSPLSSLGALEQSSSPFCTYTRQREQENETMGVTSEEPPARARPQEPGVDEGGGAATCGSEDEKREVLARDIIDKDKSLADVLDQSKRRTTMDLMEGIFPQGEELVEKAHQRRMAAPKLTSSRSTEERRDEDSMAAAAALVTSSAYYSTSAPKAELLIKMKDMQEQSVELESEEELEEENDTELAGKKHELIESLSKKLQVLRDARESLQEDVQDNNALGEEVEAIVQKVCKPNELEKFRMFVGDLDKVVSLLLSLSGRLARVENALNSLEEDAPLEERRTLMDKRKLLIRQHEDAKELKENLDRREKAVQEILCSYLQEESLADYEHFVKMKSALIIEQRKLEDKIKLGDEQLKCLMDSLPPEQRPRY